MEERPPSRSSMAGEESGAPQERRSPPEPYKVTESNPLHVDADWLPLSEEEKEAIDCIEAYGISKAKGLEQKLQFLNCICLLCSTAGKKGLTVSLSIFCLLNNLSKKIEVLLCEEPREQLSTALRYCCMNAVAALSKVNAVSEEEILHLFNVCCSVIFYLPPARALNICLYDHTLNAMDNMLQSVLDSCPTASVNSRLQRILEVLLPFTISKTKSVCERALGRIWKLSDFMTSSFWQQPLGRNLPPSQRTDIALATLEKIIGDYSFDEKKWAETMLDVVWRDPGTWLMDAREIRALLPGVMETLRFANTAITLKVLNIFRNAVRHLGKRHTSLFALELAEKILPLFNHASCEVREGSICLFTDVMDAVVWYKKGNMKKIVRRVLLPLLFQMSDETPSVAQASGEALVSCAKFLKWKELKHQARQKNTAGIMKCLLQQDRKRVKGYLQQSLTYLEDSQASLRCEAVRFIGLTGKHSRVQSEKMLNELCSALQPLEDDTHLAVCYLASETIQKLWHQKEKAASARSRITALCRWSCIAN